MRRRWVCSHCGRTLRAKLEVGVLFHKCPRDLPRRRWTMPPVADTREELLAEARGQVFHSIEDALGEAALRGVGDG